MGSVANSIQVLHKIAHSPSIRRQIRLFVASFRKQAFQATNLYNVYSFLQQLADAR